MSLAANIIIIWTGTHAGIPSGFSRETSLDGKFPKAQGAEAVNTTGGADTHTHNSPTHTHTFSSHSHTIVTHGDRDSENISSGGGSSAVSGHTHTASLDGTSGSDSGVTFTTGSGSSLPPYYEVIFIKATASALIPANAVVLWDNASLTPNGFANHSGLQGKYLRGAGTGADAGSTGGSTSHTHASDHSHSVSHSHNGNIVGGASQNNMDLGVGDGPPKASVSHPHNVVLNSTGETISYTGTITDSSIEPAYKKLRAIQNTNSGGVRVTKGMIALWLGSVGSLPQGWVLCDGTNGTRDMTDKHLKITSSDGEVGDTSTHTHSAQSPSGFTSKTGGTNDSSQTARGNHRHDINTVGTATSALASQTMTFDSSSNQPAYRTVAFIEYIRNTLGSTIL